jgi:hypothetical protein
MARIVSNIHLFQMDDELEGAEIRLSWACIFYPISPEAASFKPVFLTGKLPGWSCRHAFFVKNISRPKHCKHLLVSEVS